MAYTPVHEEWKNKPDPSTPVNAAALEHIEQGIVDAHEGLDDKSDVGHNHAAGDVTSGTFAVGRIPDLAIEKVTGLEARLTAIEGRLDSLEEE